MDIYNLGYIPQAYVYFAAQIVPALAIGSLSFGRCVQLTYSYHCGTFF